MNDQIKVIPMPKIDYKYSLFCTAKICGEFSEATLRVGVHRNVNGRIYLVIDPSSISEHVPFINEGVGPLPEVTCPGSCFPSDGVDYLSTLMSFDNPIDNPIGDSYATFFVRDSSIRNLFIDIFKVDIFDETFLLQTNELFKNGVIPWNGRFDIYLGVAGFPISKETKREFDSLLSLILSRLALPIQKVYSTMSTDTEFSVVYRKMLLSFLCLFGNERTLYGLTENSENPFVVSYKEYLEFLS
jgi:hypothetical protein